MPHSFTQLYLHVVFATKSRARLLTDKPLRLRLHAYLASICKRYESPAAAVGGVEDHVHVLCRMNGSLAVADVVRELKRQSSKWIKEQDSTLTEFFWQTGYGAFSISPSHVKVLTDYIRQQEKHHAKLTFESEYRRLLKKYNLPDDEPLFWE